jgi:hypothetical protein
MIIGFFASLPGNMPHKGCILEKERQNLVNFMAQNQNVGQLIPAGN